MNLHIQNAFIYKEFSNKIAIFNSILKPYGINVYENGRYSSYRGGVLFDDAHVCNSNSSSIFKILLKIGSHTRRVILWRGSRPKSYDAFNKSSHNIEFIVDSLNYWGYETADRQLTLRIIEL